MQTKEFSFDLPKELIAQKPVSPRDSSKLMVINRKEETFNHHIFSDLPKLLNDKYVIVFNKTKVFPARLMTDSGELLLLNQIKNNLWNCLVKPGKKFKKAKEFKIIGKKNKINARVNSINNDGTRNIDFLIDQNIKNWIEQNGYPPFPPYIKNVKANMNDYQTVYAKETGSIAAPTAGLHFTDNVLLNLNKIGIETCEITLHVGRGTFLPVKTENISDHKMHSEWYEITQETADYLNIVKKNNKKILAVGTTSVRTLESCYRNGKFHAEANETDIFIYPGYKYKAVDAILTNFHLPESTLLMLVSAFAGKDLILKAYKQAIEKKYRFYSFGDSMLII